MKRPPGLRELSDDHHTGLVLARRCKRAARSEPGPTPREAWEGVRAEFAARLEPHFRLEEDHLLPALEALGEDVLVSRLRDDHAALRALAAGEFASDAQLRRFAELLESHIRFEEREVFERTWQRLPAPVLEAIAAEWAGPRLS